MSDATEEVDERCAACGITGGGDENIKLKNCTACKLVKYCGVECQRKHRPQHKRACKKRVAELREELLFKQPESTNRGDCPICLLPIPIATSRETVRSSIYHCCSKVVCDGCAHANKMREMEEGRPQATCPFCRSLLPTTKQEFDLQTMKRVEANDPNSLEHVGTIRFAAGDYATAIEYWEKAAGLGHIESHYKLAIAYQKGLGVEKDEKRATYHLEQAAIGGHVSARHFLGASELAKHNIGRAVKHFIIGTNLGCESSIESLKKCCTLGLISKDFFDAALRAHKAAVDATKSPQRDAAEAARKRKTGGYFYDVGDLDGGIEM